MTRIDTRPDPSTRPACRPGRPGSLAGHATVMLAILVAMAASSGCGDDKKQAPAAPATAEFDLTATVKDTDGNPVAEAPIVLDGNTVGYTDRDGVFKGTLAEAVKAAVTIDIGDMQAYYVPTDSAVTTKLKRTQTADGPVKTPIAMDVTVKSKYQNYLVWLEVGCGEYLDADKCRGLPVTYGGEVVAHTDAEGNAHFAFEGVPEQSVDIGIQTPMYEPKADDDDDDAFVMKPKNPTYTVELGLDSEVLRIEERFRDPVAKKRKEQQEAKRARARARRRAYRRRHRSKSRSKSKSKSKHKNKKGSKDEPIPLW